MLPLTYAGLIMSSSVDVGDYYILVAEKRSNRTCKSLPCHQTSSTQLFRTFKTHCFVFTERKHHWAPRDLFPEAWPPLGAAHPRGFPQQTLSRSVLLPICRVFHPFVGVRCCNNNLESYCCINDLEYHFDLLLPWLSI